MNKLSTVIEITSTSIKMVAGYVLNDRVDVIYSLTQPATLFNDTGVFIDKEALHKSLMSLRHIVDSAAHIKFDIDNAIVVLPSFGLEVFHVSNTQAVLNPNAGIDENDIANIFALFKNSKLETTNEMVDIIPDYYIVDGGRQFTQPPLGQKSATLSLCAKVLTLPTKIIEEYRNAFLRAGIGIDRYIVSTLAAGSLIYSYGDAPHDFLLVDIGSHVTTASLIGGGLVYGSLHFDWGGSDITERIIENFNICEADAEKYKILYGIDNTVMNFPVPIITVLNEKNEKVSYSTEDLNKVIKKELEQFTKELNIATDQLLEKYENKSVFAKMPAIFIGGGSELHGLLSYISSKVYSEDISRRVPKSLGARSPGLFNCLGALYINQKYPNAMKLSSSLYMSKVTREE